MISCRISRTIGYVRRIKKYLPNRILILLYNSLILPYFDYCATIWGLSAECYIHKLQKLQNKFARMILQVDVRFSRSHMLSELGWQSIKQRIHYQYYLCMFKIINNLTPSYLQSLVCHSNKPIITRNNFTLSIKTPRTEYYNRSFHVYASKLWNKLPPEIQTLKSIDIFKKECKQLSLKSINKW